MGQHPHEVLELHPVQVLQIRPVREHRVHDPVPQRVDPQLGNVEDVLPDQVPLVPLVQLGEPVVEAADLSQAEARLITC